MEDESESLSYVEERAKGYRDPIVLIKSPAVSLLCFIFTSSPTAEKHSHLFMEAEGHAPHVGSPNKSSMLMFVMRNERDHSNILHTK